MIEIAKNLLCKLSCEEIIQSVSSLSESFQSFGGYQLARYQLNPDWGYHFYRLSKSESQKYIQEINFPDHITVTSFRIMHYPTGTYIGTHEDGWTTEDGPSNCGLTIQLNDPHEYVGGEAIYGGKLIRLNPGDGVFYDYSDRHGTRKLKSGDRWICNIRMLNTNKSYLNYNNNLNNTVHRV